MRMRLPASLAVLSLLALTGFGCAPKTVNIGGDTVPTGKTTYKTDTGSTGTMEVRGANQQPPEGFPKEFPIMNGFTVLNYTSVAQAEGSIVGGEWTTNSAVGDVFGYYKTQLPKNGWTITMTSTQGESSYIGFAKSNDQRYAGTLTMEKQSDGSTSVTMGYWFTKDLGSLQGTPGGY